MEAYTCKHQTLLYNAKLQALDFTSFTVHTTCEWGCGVVRRRPLFPLGDPCDNSHLFLCRLAGKAGFSQNTLKLPFAPELNYPLSCLATKMLLQALGLLWHKVLCHKGNNQYPPDGFSILSEVYFLRSKLLAQLNFIIIRIRKDQIGNL